MRSQIRVMRFMSNINKIQRIIPSPPAKKNAPEARTVADVGAGVDQCQSRYSAGGRKKGGLIPAVEDIIDDR
jgi:hypothetical protein